jgi:metallo-beta-lactamase class B
MKNYFVGMLSLGLLLTMAIPNVARAQGSLAAAQPHLDKAKEAAWSPKDGLNDLTHLYETVCGPAMSEKGPRADAEPGAPEQHKTPPRNEWYQEPSKVFDNLYWLGSWGSASRVPPGPGGQSTWAVTTSEGIILIDSGYDYSAPVLITGGLKKMGLDPTQIKYVIISHAHSDRYWGAKYLQDTYHAHLIVSEVDWHGIEISPDPEDVKPKKDMVATDGMKLTLGDTTLTMYLTPGHTPGTISTLVPLKDGNQRHLGAIWGGINAGLYGHGVRNGPTLQAVDQMWITSAARFKEIADKAGVDTYLAIHPFYDNALEKIHLLQYRKPGEPNIMVGKDNFDRFMTIIKECTEAELARLGPAPAQETKGQSGQ